MAEHIASLGWHIFSGYLHHCHLYSITILILVMDAGLSQGGPLQGQGRLLGRVWSALPSVLTLLDQVRLIKDSIAPVSQVSPAKVGVASKWSCCQSMQASPACAGVASKYSCC